jgi:hypothetical protein
MVDSPDEIRRTDTSHHVDSSVVRREASLRGVLVCVFGYRVFPQNVLSHPAAGSLPARCAQKRAFSSKSPLGIMSTAASRVSFRICLGGNGNVDDARFRKWYNAVEDPDHSPGRRACMAFHFSRKPFRRAGAGTGL